MTSRVLRVLLLEDNDEDAQLLRRQLRADRNGSFDLVHVSHLKDAMARLKEGRVDIALLDLGLPDASGLEAVQQARAAAPDVPLIVLTGADDDSMATAAIQQGAQDYLVKGQLGSRVLPRLLRYAVERHHMQLETERILKQQAQLKDEFLSHVSHELRSPLTAIYQFSTIIADGYAGAITEDQKRYADIIVRNTQQLKAMIDDLLEVSRAEAGKLVVEPQRCSVGDAIGYALDTFQESALEKQIALTSESEAGLADVYADPMRLRQMLVILVQNAIKFTPSNGRVSIYAAVYEDAPDSLLVTVSDNGCGIKPELLDSIFQNHFQAAQSPIAGRNGLGLGLFICRELALQQGGQIWAANLDPGAALSFTLPIFMEARAEKAMPPTGERRLGGDRRAALQMHPSCA